MKGTKNVSQILMLTIRASKSKVKVSTILIVVISAIGIISCTSDNNQSVSEQKVLINSALSCDSNSTTKTPAVLSENSIKEIASIFLHQTSGPEIYHYPTRTSNPVSLLATFPRGLSDKYNVTMLANFNTYVSNSVSNNFKIDWAKVCNYRSVSAVIDIQSNYGDIIHGYSVLIAPDANPSVGIMGPNDGSDVNNGKDIMSGLYALPNISRCEVRGASRTGVVYIQTERPYHLTRL